MSENSDSKKRKSPGTVDTQKKKTLFILTYDETEAPFHGDRYAIFTAGSNVEVYDKLCNALRDSMKSAAKGWEDVIEAERVWVPLMMFLMCKSKYDAAEHDGYTDEDDYQKTRNQKARQVMLVIGMIRNMKDFTSDEIGKDFVKEEIGELRFVEPTELMSMENFFSVIIVPENCNRECDKYYKKL